MNDILTGFKYSSVVISYVWLLLKKNISVFQSSIPPLLVHRFRQIPFFTFNATFLEEYDLNIYTRTNSTTGISSTHCRVRTSTVPRLSMQYIYVVYK
jgi:hypothetical protein